MKNSMIMKLPFSFLIFFICITSYSQIVMLQGVDSNDKKTIKIISDPSGFVNIEDLWQYGKRELEEEGFTVEEPLMNDDAVIGHKKYGNQYGSGYFVILEFSGNASYDEQIKYKDYSFGASVVSYGNAEVRAEENFLDRQEYDLTTEYTKQKVFVKDKFGTGKVGSYYYEDGQRQGLLFEGYINDNFKKEGQFYFYHKNGNLKQEGEYRNNLKEGLWTYYKENGDLDFTAEHTNGSSEIFIKQYYPSGKLMKSYITIDGEFDGPYKTYFENGNIEVDAYAKGEEYTGSYKEYREDGSLKETGNYLDGAKTGDWTDYRKNKDYVIKTYSDGELQRAILKHASGKTISSSEIREDDILNKEYYNNGNIKAIGTESFDRRKTGEWKHYSRFGDLIKTETYDNGKLTGIQYNEQEGKYYVVYYDQTRSATDSTFSKSVVSNVMKIRDGDIMKVKQEFNKAWSLKYGNYALDTTLLEVFCLDSERRARMKQYELIRAIKDNPDAELLMFSFEFEYEFEFEIGRKD